MSSGPENSKDKLCLQGPGNRASQTHAHFVIILMYCTACEASEIVYKIVRLTKYLDDHLAINFTSSHAKAGDEKYTRSTYKGLRHGKRLTRAMHFAHCHSPAGISCKGAIRQLLWKTSPQTSQTRTGSLFPTFMQTRHSKPSDCKSHSRHN